MLQDQRAFFLLHASCKEPEVNLPEPKKVPLVCELKKPLACPQKEKSEAQKAKK